METILGIDLGTTNSVAAIVRDGKVEELDHDGQSLLPSVVGVDNQGKLLVGDAARNQWVLAPDRTVRSIKRKMGQEEKVRMGEEYYSPQEISAMILRTIKERAEQHLGQPISKAVVTVPAFFNEQQREATRDAGRLAGFEVARIINEPTAASLAYQSRADERERLLVYDLGGGTFDVSVVQIEDGVVEVLASHGNTKLGGDDFDQLLMDHVCDAFKEEHDIDLRELPSSRGRVLRACEQLKIRLTDESHSVMEEEFIAESAGVSLHLNMEVSRLEYEELIESLLNKTLVCVDEALSDSGLAATEIDRVVLVGGASRTPLVCALLAEQLGRPIHAEVDPDRCVAIGAAIQGGLISGVDVGPVLVDITPHTLGVECVGWIEDVESQYLFSPIIHRNSALPISRSEAYSTRYDGQEVVAIRIFQGQHEDTRLNELVGEFNLEGLADVARGNSILVRFDLDLDGILTATATEKATGLEQYLTIENAMSRLRDEDHDSLQSRIDQAFGSSSDLPVDDSLAGSDSADDSQTLAVYREEWGQEAEVANVPEELRPVVDSARALIDQSLQLVDKACQEDAEEINGLVAGLKQAIDEQSADTIARLSNELDDLVFYLQDAR